MTKRDYLRQFHARHPEAGSWEPEWLRAFDRHYQIAFAGMCHNASREFQGPDALKIAAGRTERDYLKKRLVDHRPREYRSNV